MKRKISGLVAILLVASMVLWAADVSELRTQFTDALASGDLSGAIQSYDDMVSQAQKDYSKAARSYEKALEAGNIAKARSAWYDMQSIGYDRMTADETDQMLSLIVAEDEENRAADAPCR